MKIKEYVKPILLTGVTLLTVLGLSKGCNMLLNNRSIDHPGYKFESRALGPFSHTQFIEFADGSYEIKKYPIFGLRTFSSELYQDLNGDGLVDRIRRNGPEWQMNRLVELLDRKHDYETHTERFERADQELQELITRYSTK
jgi:hypothetical protein